MSLDGGYIGSIDHAIASLHTGRRQGHQQGIQEGYQQGFDDGWYKATAVGNKKMLEQLGYTRQHFTRVTELERLYNPTTIFMIIPVEERLQWRDALSRHLLNQIRSPSGFALSGWKIEEQVVPMNLVVAGLLEQGVTEPQAIEEWFDSEVTIRSDYASGK